MESSSAITETVKVFCRQRLALVSDPVEEFNASPIQFSSQNTCIYSNGKSEQQFEFDSCFQGDAQQEEVYTVVAKPLVDSVIRGYSGHFLTLHELRVPRLNSELGARSL